MIEVWVFLAGLTGACLAAWSLGSSVRELQALILSKLNGPKKLAGISNIMRDSFLMSAQVVVGALGLFLLLADTPYTVNALRIALGSLIIVSALLTLGLVVDRVRRYRVMQMYDELEAQRNSSFFHKRADDPR